jgi:hypothetical protein
MKEILQDDDKVRAEVTRLLGIMRRMPEKDTRYYQIQLLKDILKNYVESDDPKQRATLAENAKQQAALIASQQH